MEVDAWSLSTLVGPDSVAPSQCLTGGRCPSGKGVGADVDAMPGGRPTDAAAAVGGGESTCAAPLLTAGCWPCCHLTADTLHAPSASQLVQPHAFETQTLAPESLKV